MSAFAHNIKICHQCKEYSQTRRGGCSGPCPCHYDGKDIIDHARTGDCPLGKFLIATKPTVTTPTPATTPAPSTWSTQGPKLWHDLHHAAKSLPFAAFRAYLSRFSNGLLCGECKQDWIAWVNANPPDPADLFAWTVAAHNAVNVKLGKALVSVDEAQSLWK